MQIQESTIQKGAQYTTQGQGGGGNNARLGGSRIEINYYVVLTSVHCYRIETMVDS